MKIKLHQLDILLAVASQGSFGKAAKILNLTQPAISKTVQEIENEVGMPILQRTSKGVILNDYGEVLVRHAKDIDRALHQAREDIDGLLGNAMRQLRIGFTAATSYGPLAPTLLQFQTRFPEVKIITQQNRPRYLENLLAQKLLDLIVISHCTTQPANGFESELLYSLGNFIVAGRQHPVAHVASLKKLLSYPWIEWDDPHDDALLNQLCKRYNLPLPDQVIHCPSPEVMRYLLQHSSMLSMWTTAGLPLLQQTKELKKISVVETLPLTHVGIISPGLGANSSVTTSFIEMLRINTAQWLAQDGYQQFLAHQPVLGG